MIIIITLGVKCAFYCDFVQALILVCFILLLWKLSDKFILVGDLGSNTSQQHSKINKTGTNQTINVCFTFLKSKHPHSCCGEDIFIKAVKRSTTNSW